MPWALQAIHSMGWTALERQWGSSEWGLESHRHGSCLLH
jgi:hypothetical protein